jgi:hypothetical protein
VTVPAKTNPEVAALTFRRDLDRFWDGDLPGRRGWTRESVDALTELITLIADDGDQRLPFLLRARADWYPDFPLQITFVQPDGSTEPPQGSTWLPTITSQPFNFGLHAVYDYVDPVTQAVIDKRQLICFSQSFDYYASGHTPNELEGWEYPRYTLAATLNRLDTVLQAPFYIGPQSPREEVARAA